MDMKKVFIISLIAVAVVASIGAVSAGWFDGLFGEEQQDNVIEIDNMTFNTTNVTKFELFNQTEDEDGYSKWYIDENDTGYNLGVYNYSYVDDITWNQIIQSYKDYRLDNSPSNTVDGVAVYTTAANSGDNIGQPRYLSYIQNDDLKILVDFASPNPKETAKMASTFKFQ